MARTESGQREQTGRTGRTFAAFLILVAGLLMWTAFDSRPDGQTTDVRTEQTSEQTETESKAGRTEQISKQYVRIGAVGLLLASLALACALPFVGRTVRIIGRTIRNVRQRAGRTESKAGRTDRPDWGRTDGQDGRTESRPDSWNTFPNTFQGVQTDVQIPVNVGSGRPASRPYRLSEREKALTSSQTDVWSIMATTCSVIKARRLMLCLQEQGYLATVRPYRPIGTVSKMIEHCFAVWSNREQVKAIEKAIALKAGRTRDSRQAVFTSTDRQAALNSMQGYRQNGFEQAEMIETSESFNVYLFPLS